MIQSKQTCGDSIAIMWLMPFFLMVAVGCGALGTTFNGWGATGTAFYGAVNDPLKLQLDGECTEDGGTNVYFAFAGPELIGASNTPAGWQFNWTNGSVLIPGLGLCGGKVQNHIIYEIGVAFVPNNIHLSTTNVILTYGTNGAAIAAYPLVNADGSGVTNTCEDLAFLPDGRAAVVTFSDPNTTAFGASHIFLFATNGAAWKHSGFITLDTPLYGAGGILWDPNKHEFIVNAFNNTAGSDAYHYEFWFVDLQGHVTSAAPMAFSTFFITNTKAYYYGQGSPMFMSNDFSRVYTGINTEEPKISGVTNQMMYWALPMRPPGPRWFAVAGGCFCLCQTTGPATHNLSVLKGKS